MSATKLLNLQGIRGIAILAVLAFHFFPNYFPNGYLGVDQFFVLSGFLMCMLLRKTEKLPNFEMITNFYIRRFKRILPLYQLIILISLIALYLIFPDTTIEVNITSAKRAIIFITNQVKTLEDDYFEKLNMAIDIFTHTWSLSVEIQFYFIVPFLFLMPFRNLSLTILSILSLIYFYILPSDIAFFNVFARIWQFLIGMIAFIITQRISEKYELKSNELEKQQLILEQEKHFENKKYDCEFLMRALILSMVLIIFFPKIVLAVIARPLVTITTGIILIFSKGDDIFLSNKILTYIGDISYSLYLIHWPIFSYFKISKMPNNHILIFLLLSVILSILIYHNFEKWYTKQSNMVLFILTVSLFLLNLGILNYQNYQMLLSKDPDNNNNIKQLLGNGTFEDAKRLNHLWDVMDLKNLKFKCDGNTGGWCSYDGLNQNNKLRMMSFGNSWTVNHARIMYEECGPRVKEFLRGSLGGCEPLYKFPTKFLKCPEFLANIEEHLEEFKPDYAFHITSAINIGNNYTDDFRNDPIYQSILNQTRRFLKSIKRKLFILNSVPQVNLGAVERLSDDIRNNRSRDDIDKHMFVQYEEYLGASKRYKQLVKDCGSKCELIDYYDLFHPNGTKTFRYYDDNGFAYMSGGNHFTPYGLEFLRPFWRDFCSQKLV
ncbi:unnamed protein product [Caenorhabditis angaria]|uniref:Acyl_transf_3 domain-containing protein n=1 Tax=Caenorhabditis angaria TaxID=860376 RepID=A0A9P1IVK9_9PELO|nr:unnamed protein product [Caenorhabditis angaria]